MVAKRSKKEVYVQNTAFTKKELDYINKCSLSIPYEIDVTRAAILIPPDHSDIYRDNLHVLHLINNFSFTPQLTIDAKLIPVNVFNPKMRTAPIKNEDDPVEIEMPKRGEVWRDSNDSTRKYIQDVTKDGNYRVKFLESLMNDKTFKGSDIEFLVRNGYMVKEVK